MDPRYNKIICLVYSIVVPPALSQHSLFHLATSEPSVADELPTISTDGAEEGEYIKAHNTFFLLQLC